ncbi:efflux RND transporter periplasmic adaptor subunit [Halorhodospira halophila]|uniref:Efflux transporter, RND family, MFP subunit n=1 Tax=Halorhodospira halophila (strain DSM 244 / SL1) TaxID=349124 RepID=A1WXU1_HALHL|nr:efflux RND transporter periplasmic adaptor subunit [Halorhodospira halophila]ABM62503.1 efflux transporter, RND family, MFP subunit [Halorhodospira halophila SL1]MBK1728181.1 efflux RND transporter periplasmic adaptor subunit [Halorhodospira halophila]
MRPAYQILFAALLIAGVAFGGYWLTRGEPASQAGPPAGREVVVEAADAERAVIRDTFRATGTARAREALDVVTETAGRITAIGFEEGAAVEAGQILLELDAERERAALEEARAHLEDVQAQLRRARTLRETGDVTEQDVDTLAAAVAVASAQVRVAEVQLRERRIHAPFAGVVGMRGLSLGAYVDPQTVVTTLDDTEILRLVFTVPERLLGRLETGLAVTAGSAGFPEHRFSGVLHRIDSRIDPVTRTLRLESEIDNRDGRLKPGMFLQVELELDRRQAVVIPEEALILDGPRRYVYRITDGVARQVDVEIGQRQNGRVEISAGLEPADRVVALGHQRLSDGTRVRVRNRPAGDAANGSGLAEAAR